MSFAMTEEQRMAVDGLRRYLDDVIEPEFEEIFRADADAIRTKLGAPVEVWIPPPPPSLAGKR